MGPIQLFLGIFGTTGITAYVGLLTIGQLKEGERVFVSAASGAVGLVASQIAKGIMPQPQLINLFVSSML